MAPIDPSPCHAKLYIPRVPLRPVVHAEASRPRNDIYEGSEVGRNVSPLAHPTSARKRASAQERVAGLQAQMRESFSQLIWKTFFHQAPSWDRRGICINAEIL